MGNGVLAELLESHYVPPGAPPPFAADIVVIGPSVRHPLQEAALWGDRAPMADVVVLATPEETGAMEEEARRRAQTIHVVEMTQDAEWFVRSVQRARARHRAGRRRQAGSLERRARELL